MSETRRTAAVVGGGPVGCLAALSLAKMGWRVELYEGRPDPRMPSYKATQAQRSINLAISSRGLAAIASVEPAMAVRFLDTVIPMHGRMIHGPQGSTSPQMYDVHGQSINSIDRALLNESLLNEVAACADVAIHFEHKLATADFDERRLDFNTPSGSRSVTFDFCIGADGSHSNVRRQMMRFVRMDFEQEYIPHEYVELRMPAGVATDGDSAFKMEPNYLHIWPRHQFMLIALPNKDKTFTCTVFAPTDELDKLLPGFSFSSAGKPRTMAPTPSEVARITSWFRQHFPDVLDLIGAERLVHDFWYNPRSALICVKASPYHYRDRVILLGDAAHAMTPFFGQGLNCGLEDVRVLSNLMRSCGVGPDQSPLPGGEDERLATALQTYTDTRREDLAAISQMAMDNYSQMRDHVTRPLYLVRKALEEVLHRVTSAAQPLNSVLPALSTSTFIYADRKHSPWSWLPLYTMVTFRPDISYAVAKTKAERQSRILSLVGWAALAASVTSVVAWSRRR